MAMVQLYLPSGCATRRVLTLGPGAFLGLLPARGGGLLRRLGRGLSAEVYSRGHGVPSIVQTSVSFHKFL